MIDNELRTLVQKSIDSAEHLSKLLPRFFCINLDCTCSIARKMADHSETAYSSIEEGLKILRRISDSAESRTIQYARGLDPISQTQLSSGFGFQKYAEYEKEIESLAASVTQSVEAAISFVAENGNKPAAGKRKGNVTVADNEKDDIFSLASRIEDICGQMHDSILLLGVLDEDTEKDAQMSDSTRAVYSIQRYPTRMAILRIVEREIQQSHSELTKASEALYSAAN